jgi:hypothetical protein
MQIDLAGVRRRVPEQLLNLVDGAARVDDVAGPGYL